ncbi:MAG TPA: ATP-binding protein [Solirubrobacterales bacterium]|nr:ATP-binding protein [Solirubrobacterales bacterium]
MSRFVTVLPSARKLMESLRDIGYDLPSAVADLVDNSIDAGAENVDVTFVDDGVGSWIRIADDGMGMSAGELDEAMRYGSRRDYSSSALGHFGLGLKTGSLSQCRRLTVASRRRRNARIVVRSWDLDLVAERDSWDLDSPPRAELPPHLLEPLEGSTGTVVLWENLDRILAFRNPGGATTQRALNAMASDVSAHLGMVFHRFITGEWAHGEAFVNLAVNGTPVTAWDPFAREEKATTGLPKQTIELTREDGPRAKLTVQPYVLPAQNRFSTPEAHQTAAGPNRWNRQQGFYVYRRDRMIQSGGWNRIRTLDEHAKLARIAIDLPTGHEELFGINVSKMSIVIPEAARASLRTIAAAVVQQAQWSYRDHLNGSGEIAGGPGQADIQGDQVRPPGDGGPSISGDWPLISRTINEALRDDPGRRDDLLVRLVNAFD